MKNQVIISFLLIFFLSISFSELFAQKGGKKSQDIRVADTYFQNQEYFLAADYYKKGIETQAEDPYANYMLAECYRLYYDYNSAEKQYLKASKLSSQEFPLARFWYSMMLKSNGKYELAKFEFDGFLNEFRALRPEDQQIKNEAELERDGCVLALKELKKPIRNYDFQNLPGPINSDKSEYAPNFYLNDSTIVFASAREGTKGKELDTRSGEGFSDIFRYQLRGNRWVEMSDEDKFSELNTIRNDGAGTFTKDKNKFYFTSCIEEDYPCAIYVTKLVNGKWLEAERLNDNINIRGYESKQPTLTIGGDTMIFVSDQPNGKGLNDLYFSIKLGEEDWQGARNMGPINTVYQDIAPFYDDDDKTLFFSSNGRQGFGGLDIFKAQGARLENITNMGIPFNTNRDEFYLSLGEKKGLLSSNREGGKGTDDIYYFNIESSELLLATIGKDDLGKDDNFSLITNLHYKPEGDPAVDVPVLLTDENGNVILRSTSNELGSLSFDDLSPDKEYKLILENDDDNIYAEIIYKGRSGEFDLNAEKNGAVLAVVTKAIIDQFNSMTILSKISYSESGEPASDIPIVLVDENGVILKRGKTNADGLGRFEELDSDKGYRILIDEDDPRLTADVKFLVDDITVKWQRQGGAIISNTDDNKLGEPVKSIGRVTFENIYFDFNDFAIRKEAKKTLNDVAKYLKENKEVQIEINANADNVGSDDYNKTLSEKRGKAVVAYLENSGVDKSAIVINVLGSKSPIASNETPIGRQLNRRVEFYVVGGQGYSTQVMTYVLEPNKSLSDVANAFGMSTSELKEMNSLNGENDLRSFVPLRVRKTGDNNLIAPVSMAAASSDKYKNLDDVSSVKGGSKASKGVTASLPSLEPGLSYHVVEPLETLFRIAYSHGMTVKEIKALNNLNTEIIQIGQAIVVKENKAEKIDIGPGRYVVKDGDTLYDIAKAHGVSTKQIMEWNNLDSPVLYQTMVLKVAQD